MNCFYVTVGLHVLLMYCLPLFSHATGMKAVDSLMESKWTKEPKNPDSDEPYFINRTFAVDYCSKLVMRKNVR